MEAPPTTIDTAPVTGGVAPTRGRGGGMRGSYERGRGRGMGRGHFGGVGGPGGFPSRGGYVPRGGMGGPPMGYPGRGGYAPRGAPPMRGAPGMGGPGGYQGRGGAPRGGPPMRGTGRMPLYSQPPKQHTGVDNNKTVSPVQANVANQVVAGTEETTTNSVKPAPVTNTDPNATTTVAAAAPITSKPISTGVSPNYRGTGRGRGMGGPRGRGGYNPHNGSAGMSSMYSGGPQIGEHGVMRRGGPPRGRGQYSNTGMTRPPMMQQQPHVVNTQVTQPNSLKRGAPGGPPGPKRGRYEGGPYSQRAPAPKYHQPPHMAPPTSYGVQHQQAPPPPPQSHHAYAQHDPSQTMDPYAQSYAAPQTQAPYNGYGQTTAYSHAAAPTHPTAHQANSGYATHAATEYDQSQYQGYSSAYAQPDTRYQTYGQDYTQQYGAPAVDYSTSQADYTQHAQQSYDERAYAGYDTQSYQQGYTNSTGYY
ncbi:trithorax group protein osa [Lucilia sericata]|uniref:trithorax group protein osa n=1 Tax=Lucilia sericata TaxID=13632 RepID=UPI0018A7F2B1|nr:trithorax group protein osa [Lucilia sericata]